MLLLEAPSYNFSFSSFLLVVPAAPKENLIECQISALFRGFTPTQGPSTSFMRIRLALPL